VIQPVFLIGAARSGTKLVRDVIARHPAVSAVPYDINYVWRLGNDQLPDDELDPGLATPSIRSRVRAGVLRFSTAAPVLIEKTVSNTLRVDFVQRIFSEARYIHLVRDGRDVVESSYRQWTAKPDWRYVLAKAASFPLRNAMRYAARYAMETVRRSIRRDSDAGVPAWGPRYRGIDADLATRDVIEVCAIQWQRCVLAAVHGLRRLDPSQVIDVRYEALVAEPEDQIARILNWLDIDPAPLAGKVADVSDRYVGVARTRLDSATRDRVERLIAEGLEACGYTRPPGGPER
jgi:hypothetical protein